MLNDRRRADRDRREASRVPAVFAVTGTLDGLPNPPTVLMAATGTPALQGDASGRVHLGQAEDIAPEGMTLRWPRDSAPAPCAPISLSFEIPGTQQAIAAQALVVTCSTSGRFRRTGVRFTALTPEHAALIVQYCDAIAE